MNIHDKVLGTKALEFFFFFFFKCNLSCLHYTEETMFHKTTASVRTGSYVARFPNSKTSDITTCSSD